MPKLLDNVVLLVDCEVIGGSEGGASQVMPRGSRGVLVDQNTVHPDIWIIEFATPTSSRMVLVETSEQQFAVYEKQG